MTLGAELLTPTRLYVTQVLEAIKSGGYDPIKMTPMDEVARPLEESQ